MQSFVRLATRHNLYGFNSIFTARFSLSFKNMYKMQGSFMEKRNEHGILTSNPSTNNMIRKKTYHIPKQDPRGDQ